MQAPVMTTLSLFQAKVPLRDFWSESRKKWSLFCRKSPFSRKKSLFSKYDLRKKNIDHFHCFGHFQMRLCFECWLTKCMVHSILENLENLGISITAEHVSGSPFFSKMFENLVPFFSKNGPFLVPFRDFFLQGLELSSLVQALEDANIEGRHIVRITGHKSQDSINQALCETIVCLKKKEYLLDSFRKVRKQQQQQRKWDSSSEIAKTSPHCSTFWVATKSFFIKFSPTTV